MMRTVMETPMQTAAEIIKQVHAHGQQNACDETFDIPSSRTILLKQVF
jgi:uncharacterized protein YqgV (UPF0045/DUF77 family)